MPKFKYAAFMVIIFAMTIAFLGWINYEIWSFAPETPFGPTMESEVSLPVARLILAPITLFVILCSYLQCVISYRKFARMIEFSARQSSA